MAEARSPVASTVKPPMSEVATAGFVPPGYLRFLEELAFRDYLTGLPNRRALEFDLEQRFSALRRYGVSFGVLLADLDNFKEVNDRYGHPAGDRLLQAIADSLRKSIRGADSPGRWGGEEFLVTAPFTDRAGLATLAERVRAEIATTFVPMGHARLRVTASIGTTVCEASDTPSTLIKRADRLLYQSKTLGKDRVTCS